MSIPGPPFPCIREQPIDLGQMTQGPLVAVEFWNDGEPKLLPR